MAVIVWGILTQALHIALMLAAAPLLTGVVRWLKARMMGRRGPHPAAAAARHPEAAAQAPVLAENASAISRAAPYLAAGAAVAAAALVPSFARGMAFAPLADLILVAGLLALGRVAMALAGMDVGTPFGGLGAAREMSFAALAEPALVVAALTLAILAGTTNLDAIAATLFREGGLGLRVSLGLALVALLAVAIAENARIPVDNPATHLELTMVHEAMILEASAGTSRCGRRGDAAADAVAGAALGDVPALRPGAGRGRAASLGARAARLGGEDGGLALALAAFESAIAKMRVFRVPEFLGAALLLGLLGAVLLFVSTRLA
jgi:formate hydrogenlyase subunit 4